MRKSAYGKEIVFVWEGLKRYDETTLMPVASTLQITEELQEKISERWKTAIAVSPHLFDGCLWRTESVIDEMPNIVFNVSPIRYSQHNVLRHVQDQPMGFYPNPLTINTLQETADGYIAIGVRGKASDQTGLTLMGAGFVDRYENEDGSSKQPQNLWQIVQKECKEETHYCGINAFDITNAKALAAIFCSNHDTTVCFHLPLNVEHGKLALGNDEHSDLLFLPNNPEEILQVLKTEKFKGIPAGGHLLGCLETYLSKKSSGQIKSNYQH